jgi:cell filamentation protein
MKQRVLVMNGQRLLQSEQNGEWNTVNVQKAGDLKPGIYHLYLAKDADKERKYIGYILHTDKDYVYQQYDKNLVRHERAAFDVVPNHGTLKSISYDQERAIVAVAVQKRGRGLTR